jgi:2'-5' RNA ligase
MSDTTRTFLAIAIPEAMGAELARVQKTLAPELPACRWGRGNGHFHMTLAFLGDVRNRELPRLHELVAVSVGGLEPCEMHLLGLGAFPSAARPRVLWAGVSARNPALLEEIQKAIADAAARAGYRPAEDRFHPHVTLGRIKPDRRRGACDVTAVVERYRSWSCGEFRAVEVTGFASRLSAAGPSHEALWRARLGGEKSGPLT